MDSALNTAIEHMSKLPGVSGIVCTDRDGLCILARGTPGSAAAGAVCEAASGATAPVQARIGGTPAVVYNLPDVSLAVFMKETA
mmetsp:Transcript_7793/g.19304  ORF Transcript_7793/g.19304 Transcript_7793/m.19304 type:complete len:84 (-) Transcript_7793:48-299(-)